MNTSLLTLAWTLGGPEIAVIFLVVLLLFGAKKIPELARGLGKSMGEFKKARTEFEDEIKRAEHEDDDAKAEKMAKEASGKEETDHHA
jgi:sec-independent protein translocase protein TatA